MIKRVVLLLCVALVFSACDGFLEEEPETFLTPGQFYNTPDEARAALYAVYDLLGSNDLYGSAGSGMILFTDLTANSSQTDHPSYVQYERYEIFPTTPDLEGIWVTSYEGINRANAVIDNVQASDINTDIKGPIVGEAKFLRAFYYFNLVRLFGGVPLVVQESTSLEGLEIPRASEEEVYQQITQDLEDAAASLSVEPPAQGRATSGAARALLAKAYLTLEECQLARDQAREVMDLGTYGLWADYADVFKVESENGKESVFAVQFEQGVNEGSMVRIHSSPIELNDFVSGGPVFHIQRPAENLISSYEPGDERLRVNVRRSIEIDGETITFEFPAFWKYNDGLLSDPDISDADLDFPIIRYADVLLTFAEAENCVAGPTDAALEAVNRVRRRAFTDGEDLDSPSEHDFEASLGQGGLREAIWNERLREFPLEAKQWFTLKRTGRLVDVLGIEEYKTVYPIPQREMEVNLALEQNPGY